MRCWPGRCAARGPPHARAAPSGSSGPGCSPTRRRSTPGAGTRPARRDHRCRRLRLARIEFAGDPEQLARLDDRHRVERQAMQVRPGPPRIGPPSPEQQPVHRRDIPARGQPYPAGGQPGRRLPGPGHPAWPQLLISPGDLRRRGDPARAGRLRRRCPVAALRRERHGGRPVGWRPPARPGRRGSRPPGSSRATRSGPCNPMPATLAAGGAGDFPAGQAAGPWPAATTSSEDGAAPAEDSASTRARGHPGCSTPMTRWPPTTARPQAQTEASQPTGSAAGSRRPSFSAMRLTAMPVSIRSPGLSLMPATSHPAGPGCGGVMSGARRIKLLWRVMVRVRAWSGGAGRSMSVPAQVPPARHCGAAGGGDARRASETTGTPHGLAGEPDIRTDAAPVRVWGLVCVPQKTEPPEERATPGPVDGGMPEPGAASARTAGETSRAHARRLERGLAAGRLVMRVTYPYPSIMPGRDSLL